ncbi:RidA family protein [Enterovirga sp.]|uniref:RidA family protein n=1 Tax=Enterovirga sp. TaxID=2026350 RepID=UPI002C20BA46|nr:RidA family protein [Enterovirga sp.]HMO28674.1 RidA family protein [Enterovirga sp.]
MKIIATEAAPKAIGPYCQAVVHGGLLYCSGQIPLDPATMKVVEGGIVEQTERVFANLEAVLRAAGTDFSKVLKTTVFLSNLEEFPKMNEVFARAFGEHRPARSTVQVARLPLDVRVEIECIAALA